MNTIVYYMADTVFIILQLDVEHVHVRVGRRAPV